MPPLFKQVPLLKQNTAVHCNLLTGSLIGDSSLLLFVHVVSCFIHFTDLKLNVDLVCFMMQSPRMYYDSFIDQACSVKMA